MTPSMTQTRLVEGVDRSVAGGLRRMAMPWAVAGMLPLPLLVTTEPSESGVISCLYLGLASAWLVAEVERLGGRCELVGAWRARRVAVGLAVLMNVAMFIGFGLAAGVRTQFPFPLMAALSAVPAVGVVPWLMRRVGHPYAAIVLAAVLVGACKLAGCVVARVVYGPDCNALGYVSADWHAARLMISLFWIFSTTLSVGLLVAEGMGRGVSGGERGVES
jgi:hypothetical protein